MKITRTECVFYTDEYYVNYSLIIPKYMSKCKTSLNQQKEAWINKNPNLKSSENTQGNAWKNAWKHEIKCKMKGKKDLLAYEVENLAKIRRKMTKNCGLALSNSKREKIVWKPFWKVSLKCQTRIFKNLIHEFRLIKN